MNNIDMALTNALHTNDTIKISAVLDRRTLPTDKQRSQAAQNILQGLNLLESDVYPINGLILAEGFPDEIRKILESEFVTTANLVN